jgi:hypothetical protein
MIKRFMALITVCLIVMCSALPVFADNSTSSSTSSTSSNSSQDVINESTKTVNIDNDTNLVAAYGDSFERLGKTGSTEQSDEGKKGLNYKIVVNNKTYYVAKSAYDSAVQRVKSYQSNTSAADDDDVAAAKEQVKGMTNNLNMGADVGTASLILSGIEPFITTVLGIMVYIVTAGMTIFTVCDLCYIYIPAFREKTSEMAQSGNAVMSKTSKETGESKFRFVTDEALYAVQSCSVETGKHPASVWIKKRVWAYILLGLAIFILLTGNITLIVNIVLNVVGGVVSALQSFGA